MNHRISAFTLVETILYLALFNIIFFSVITWAITLTQSNRNAEYRNAIEKNAIFVTEHLSDTFRRGRTVVEDESSFHTGQGSVRISTDSDYFDYNVQNQRLRVNRNGGTFLLTDPFVQVTEFRVQPVRNEGEILGVRVRITFIAEKYPSVTKTIESYYAFR
ncbi:MAG: hypothetical protein QY312_00325 [Candidatus Dojkabacteria bacterium]|nr:MAG: hypothetical protein QY312_00325 [Candidatus Dojkabacteria bacterium]